MTTDAKAGRRRDGAEPGPATQDDVTDLVIRQFPDEALMRRRAYSQALNRTKSRRPAMLGPERQA